MSSESRIALVTGANRGLGLETARQLAKLGVQVIVSARNKENLEQTKEQFEQERIDAEYVQLDVTKQGDIKNVHDLIADKYGKLDILVNNAGISKEIFLSYTVNTSHFVDAAVIQEVYNTNIFGVIAITQALLPLLEKSGAASIVNLSSELGSLAMHADKNSPVYKLKKFAYNSSKTALNQFTVHLAEAVEQLGIKVNSVSPGWVKTDMGTKYAPLEITEGAEIIIAAATLPADGPNGCFFTHGMKAVAW